MTGPPRERACCVVTPAQAGAVAIVHLLGDTAQIFGELTGIGDWPPGRIALATVGDIKAALCASLDPERGFIMPHGGIRALQKVVEIVRARGVRVIQSGEVDPVELFPEAESRKEALLLSALARAASPLAIDLLLRQRVYFSAAVGFTAEDRARSIRLNRLLDPPLVVLVGVPNVGKSTLSNALAGRSLSITADFAGTTRDYIAARVDIGGLVVNWVDTPGRRSATGDEIEERAVEIADRLIATADLIVAMADAASDWPRLSREPHLRIASKSDLRLRRDADLALSAKTGEGIVEFSKAVRERLAPADDLEHPGPWLFDPRLENPNAPQST